MNRAGVVAAAPAPSPVERERAWQGEPARLDRVLPELGLARSRSQAAELIAAGQVSVDGRVVAKAGARVDPGARVRAAGADHYVSRGARKLLEALDRFGVDPGDRLALDLGASTGGFTQVLLERGARLVLAIDVGHDQLAPGLRGDPRVRLVEGCNARELTRGGLAAATGAPGLPSVVVADLSFISLRLVLPAISRVASPDADVVLLIKPQFEVGRQGVREGIVGDPALHASAIRDVLGVAADWGLGAAGLAPSPIAGASGNREFLVHLRAGPGTDPAHWEERILAITRSTGTSGDSRHPAPAPPGAPGSERGSGSEPFRGPTRAPADARAERRGA